MPFIIRDWAGNILFGGETFDTFEDGWARVDEFLASQGLSDDEMDEASSDYFVDPLTVDGLK